MIIEKAEIRVVNEVRSGTSQSSGREWKSQEVVIAWKERLTDGREVENLTVAALHGEGVDRFVAAGGKVGAVMNVDVAFGTRSFNGRVYCDNRMYI